MLYIHKTIVFALKLFLEKIKRNKSSEFYLNYYDNYSIEFMDGSFTKTMSL